MAEKESKSALSGITSQLPVGRLKEEAQGLGQALTRQGLSKASSSVESLTGRLSDFAEGKSTATKAAVNVAQGDSPIKGGVKAAASKVKDTVKDKLGIGGGGGGGGKLKVTNIMESVDVPVSREVAYEQWTQFEDFPTFMKKVENVSQDEDEKLTWKAQILWSHRSWNAEIVEQVPNERIVWKSDGEKGSVDGAITFHELASDLTRILMVLEYHPKGFFEHTGNMWRAQGRRARLELKHFARHVSTQTILHQDELEGWKGEIREGEVVEGESEQESEEKSEGRSRSEEKKAPAKKSTAKKAPAKKSAAKQAPSKKTAAAKKAPAKKSSTTQSTAKKAPAKKASSSQSTAKKTAAKKTSSSRSTAKKAPAKKASSSQSTAKKTAAKKASSSRSTAKKAPAKKTSAAKKAPAKKSTAKKSSASKRTGKATAR